MEVARRTFPAKLDCLYQILAWSIDQLKTAGFQKADLRKIELALEEAVVNIIEHSYQDQEPKKVSQDALIEMSISFFEGEKVEFQIKDSGPSFNPLLKTAKVQPDLPLSEREEGGLGIFLIRQYMDQVSYQRKYAKNVLTLVKKIPKK